MTELKGFDQKYRKYFSQLVGRGKIPITIGDASIILGVPHDKAKMILYRLARSGWLFRVKQGVYLPAPQSYNEGQPFVGDPWILANALFEPCYIGGWDAISHWDLTDQIFRNTFVYTSAPQKKSMHTYLGHIFLVHKISEDRLFGLKTVWKGNAKLKVSDPSRTMIDMLESPQHFGGSKVLQEVFREYLSSEHKDVGLLIKYALDLKNGAVIKRLGFLLESEGLLTSEAEKFLLEQKSQGKVKLVPSQSCPRLVTKWQLWVPDSFKKEKQ
ncbi:MAG: hypothetical protein KBB83_03270 [Alphaproteobacteria bacterium]|nr:hypothetical protein [Alphaproteobacteria bacterium]